MRKILLYIILLNCNSCVNKKLKKSDCIIFYSQYLIKNDFGKTLIYDSVANQMLFFKDSILRKSSTIEEVIVNGVIKETSVKYSYLFFKPADKIGKYISWDDTLNRQINVRVDSVFSFYNSTLSQNYYDLIEKGNFKLIESIKTRHELIKKYSFYDSLQKTNGEWHLSFTNKYESVPFSMSKQFDSITKMKLYKLKILVFNQSKNMQNTSTLEIGFHEANDSLKKEMINWKRIYDSTANIH